MSGTAIYLLGPPRIERNGDVLKVGRRTMLALLSYLAVVRMPQRRETLISLLWSDVEPALGRSYLRRDLALLTKLLGRSLLDVDRESVTLTPPGDISVDVISFRQFLASAGNHGHTLQNVCSSCMPILAQAIALYRGDFMMGFTVPNAVEFDEWQMFETEGLRRGFASALSRLAVGHAIQGEYAAAIQYATHWLQLDPCQETAHRQLMRLHLWNGDRTSALRQYQECARVLQRDLGQEPEETTRALMEDIRSNRTLPRPTWANPSGALAEANEPQISGQPVHGTAPLVTGTPDEGTGQRFSDSHLPRHSLPAQLTPFIGREQELAEVTRLLVHEPGCHLLTIVGLGGIGKTRLAIQVAGQVLSAFPGGVFFVPLASIASPEQIVPTVADALGLSFHERADPQIQLLDYLREKTLLLVLDNFEHLLEGAVLLNDILANAPTVRLLVTSQERLRLSPEWVWELQGLEYPASSQIESFERIDQTADGSTDGQAVPGIEQYSAARLFVDTARRVQPGFALSDTRSQMAVLRVCWYLQGMPLGLELASSWIRFMRCEEIAQEISQNLDILSTSLRDVPARHRNVRSLLKRSWEHLTEQERRLLAALSVFQGGFTRDAAEKVADASLPLLSGLVERFMLHRESTGRYDMHRLMRQFAMDELRAMPDVDESAHDRHCSFYAAFLQARQAQLSDTLQRRALTEISSEIDNIRVAWKWAIANNKLMQIEQFLDGLYLFYFRRSWYQEGEGVFQRAASALQVTMGQATGLDKPPDFLSEQGRQALVWGQLLARQGRFAYRLGLRREAEKALEDSVRILGHLERDGLADARQAKAFSLYHLSEIAFGNGHYEQSQKLCEESLAIWAENTDRSGLAMAQRQLGIIAGTLGDYDRARTIFRKVQDLYWESGDQYGIANALNDLAIVADLLGESGEAMRLHEASLVIRREIGHLAGIGGSLNNLGYFAYLHKDYTRAKQLLEESLVIQREIGDRLELANCLCNLGRTTCAMGEYQACQEYFQEALRIAYAIHSVPLILEILAGIASLLVACDPTSSEQAANLCAFVLQHPASDSPTKVQAQRELARLRLDFPEGIIDSAVDPGKTGDWHAVAKKLLAGTVFELV